MFSTLTIMTIAHIVLFRKQFETELKHATIYVTTIINDIVIIIIRKTEIEKQLNIYL